MCETIHVIYPSRMAGRSPQAVPQPASVPSPAPKNNRFECRLGKTSLVRTATSMARRLTSSLSGERRLIGFCETPTAEELARGCKLVRCGRCNSVYCEYPAYTCM